MLVEHYDVGLAEVDNTTSVIWVQFQACLHNINFNCDLKQRLLLYCSMNTYINYIA